MAGQKEGGAQRHKALMGVEMGFLGRRRGREGMAGREDDEGKDREVK